MVLESDPQKEDEGVRLSLKTTVEGKFEFRVEDGVTIKPISSNPIRLNHAALLAHARAREPELIAEPDQRRASPGLGILSASSRSSSRSCCKSGWPPPS